MDVKIRNKDRLFAKLRALRPKTTFELAKAAAVSANEVAELAKRLVPIDDGVLRNSIVAKPGEGMAPSARVEAGDGDAFYARWVEFGTAPHTMSNGTQHPGNKPQPFLFPAYRLLKRKLVRRFGSSIGKAVRAVS